MSSKVNSAGRAFFPLHGKSKEQAWKELTSMFNEHLPMVHTSYILQHFPLECVKRHKPDDISVGDIFKYMRSRGSKMYVQIVECTPYESFAYDEQGMPTSGEHIDVAYKSDSRDRMEFFLRSHPEATLVEIRRREKGLNRGKSTGLFNSGLFSTYLLTEEDLARHAARTLQHILTGDYWKIDEIMRGELTIKRDDSYKIDF
jgi:hypothetical protein